MDNEQMGIMRYVEIIWPAVVICIAMVVAVIVAMIIDSKGDEKDAGRGDQETDRADREGDG